MTKTRSGDEEDNGSAQDKNIFNWKENRWFELDELPNILKERIGMKEVFEGGKFKDAGFMLPLNDLATLVSDVDEHNLMFANLGEAYGTKPKSLAHLMFNT